jgi:hypothetical protein
MSDRATMGKINSPLTLGGNGRWSTTSRRPQTAFVYDRGTIVLHWCTALLVGALWILGQTIDDFPAGPWRVDARSFHIALGVTVAVVLVIRVTWRDRGVGALRPDRTGWPWGLRMRLCAATTSSTCSPSSIFLTGIAICANSSVRCTAGLRTRSLSQWPAMRFSRSSTTTCCATGSCGECFPTLAMRGTPRALDDVNAGWARVHRLLNPRA